ncbi:MAG: type II toxin-antitoxin system MqsA family antitoxin [Gemmatimonadetes bacterium]|nr:type II toxin-antitoxin system MqsA family antitoxin [Gemmatimonadota bacterium]
MNKCTLCSEGQYLNKNIVFSSRRGDQLVVIEGVPALVCDVCGDRIITEDTAREIERIATGTPIDSAPLYHFPQKVA